MKSIHRRRTQVIFDVSYSVSDNLIRRFPLANADEIKVRAGSRILARENKPVAIFRFTEAFIAPVINTFRRDSRILKGCYLRLLRRSIDFQPVSLGVNCGPFRGGQFEIKLVSVEIIYLIKLYFTRQGEYNVFSITS